MYFTRSAALSLTLAFAAVPASVAAGPQAAAPNPIVDVGVVAKGETIQQEFVIQNLGDETLEISEVKPSCGCTVASFARTIRPGGTGKISVNVDSSSFRGPIAKSVTVFTNDPENPRILLTVKANIRSKIEVRPGYARWVVVVGEDYEPSEQVLRPAAGESSFEIAGVDSPYPFVRADYTRAPAGEEGEGEWRLKLSLAADAPIGPMADFVVVRVDHPDQKEVRIPVSGFVRPPMVAIPEVFDFGRRKLDEPYPGTVAVKVLASRPVSLSEAATDLDGVAVEIETVEEGRLYNLVIRLQPEMPKGLTEGTLTVRTSSVRTPVIEIPIKGTVQ